MMQENEHSKFAMQENEYGKFAKLEPSLKRHFFTDKKANVEYWDGIDTIAAAFIEHLAMDGGIVIHEFKDLSLIKDVVELITSRLTAEFGTNFPIVDGDF